jgi:hypothetical protein
MYSKTKHCSSPRTEYSNICTYKTSGKPEEKRSFGRIPNILGNNIKHVPSKQDIKMRHDFT